MSVMTYDFTLSFFLSAPGVAESSANGFLAVSVPIDQILPKDIVLLKASLCSLSVSMEIDMEKLTS
jgi:reactive chlorine resistance protein C